MKKVMYKFIFKVLAIMLVHAMLVTNTVWAADLLSPRLQINKIDFKDVCLSPNSKIDDISSFLWKHFVLNENRSLDIWDSNGGIIDQRRRLSNGIYPGQEYEAEVNAFTEGLFNPKNIKYIFQDFKKFRQGIDPFLYDNLKELRDQESEIILLDLQN